MSATKIIHSIPSDPLTGAISVPVYQTSTFIQEAPGVNKGFDYARSNNPTRKVLEDVVEVEATDVVTETKTEEASEKETKTEEGTEDAK